MSEVLAHRVDGAGEPVLLLNGGMMSMSAWQEIAAPLAERYQVVRCDFRGQLTSAGPPHATLAAHVDDVVALLDHLRIKRAHLVGTSFGGEIGLLLAATHPQRVASLVAITVTDVVTPMIEDGGAQLRERLLAAHNDDGRRAVIDSIATMFYSPAWVATHQAELARRADQLALLPREWFEGGAAILASVADLDLRPLLGSIACPTLVVAAELDLVMPLANARSLAAAISGARLEVVEGSGHVLVQEQPGRVLELIVGFLSELEGAGDREPVIANSLEDT